jgi:hypothetical protein
MTRRCSWSGASCRDGRWWQPNTQITRCWANGYEVIPVPWYWGDISNVWTGAIALSRWHWWSLSAETAGGHTGAVTGATRTCNATPECSALKTMPVVGAPRHDRVRGQETLWWITVYPWFVTDVIVKMLLPSQLSKPESGPVLCCLNDRMRWR